MTKTKVCLALLLTCLVCQSLAQVYRVGICRENVADISLTCPDVRDVVINGWETRHIWAGDSLQQCFNCESKELKCYEEWNVPGLAAELQRDCEYKRDDKSNCILTQSTLSKYFDPKVIPDPYWNKVPIRMEVKYTCCSKSLNIFFRFFF